MDYSSCEKGRITFLRTEDIYPSLEEAKLAISRYSEANYLLDGEPIIARYYDDDGLICVILGICTVTEHSGRCVSAEQLSYITNQDILSKLAAVAYSGEYNDLLNTPEIYGAYGIIVGKNEVDNVTTWTISADSNVLATVQALTAHTSNSVIHVTQRDKNEWSGKSVVTVSNNGSSTDEISYITINGVQSKIKGSDIVVNDGRLTIKKNNNDTGSVFTANQASDTTVNLGMSTVATSGSYNDLVDRPTIPTSLSQLSDDTTHRLVTDTDIQNWNGKYTKPNTGIPKTDLDTSVQSSLGKADTSVQPSDISDMQVKSNIRTTFQTTPDNDHYPSEKLVKDSLDEKEPTLATQTSYTSQGDATHVPQITTNTKGQVTGITEVAIAFPSGSGSVTGDATTFVKDVTLSGHALTGQTQAADSQITDTASGIPTTAAVREFVNSSVSNMAANYITKNTNGDAFSSNAELVGASTYYSGGVVFTPTKNDYAIVLDDETKAEEISGYTEFSNINEYIGFYVLIGTTYTLVTDSNVSSLSIVPGATKAYELPTTRYVNTSATATPSWSFQYIINDSGFTAAQIAAINSGINATKVSTYETHVSDTSIHVTSSDKTNWNNKLDPVTAVTHDSTKNYVKQVTQSTNGQVSIVEGVLDYNDLVNTPTIPDISGKADKVNGATNGDLAGLDGNGNLTDSGVPKGILDKMPSSIGTAGQAIVVNSAATGLEFGTLSTSLSGLTDTTISSPSNGQVLTYDNTNTVWKNQNLPTQVNADWNSSSGVSQILNKPTIPSAPGALDTTATTSQAVSASESFSSNITLHKISKTGDYNDAVNRPYIFYSSESQSTTAKTLSGGGTVMNPDLGLHIVSASGKYTDLLNKPKNLVMGETLCIGREPSNYFYFEIDSFTDPSIPYGMVGFTVNGNDWEYGELPTFEYSFDKINWSGTSPYNFGTDWYYTSILIIGHQPGDRMYMRQSSYSNGKVLGKSATSYIQFTISNCTLKSGGDVTSLLNGWGLDESLTNKPYCFYGLFKNCTNLLSAPEFPSLILSGYCYSNTFYGCINLESGPSVLPSPSYTDYTECYSYMFYGCSSLTKSPIIENAYNYGYHGGLDYMFYDCSSLNEITCKTISYWGTIPAVSFTHGVAANGTFYGYDQSMWESGENGIPTGWTFVQTQ